MNRRRTNNEYDDVNNIDFIVYLYLASYIYHCQHCGLLIPGRMVCRVVGSLLLLLLLLLRSRRVLLLLLVVLRILLTIRTWLLLLRWLLLHWWPSPLLLPLLLLLLHWRPLLTPLRLHRRPLLTSLWSTLVWVWCIVPRSWNESLSLARWSSWLLRRILSRRILSRRARSTVSWRRRASASSLTRLRGWYAVVTQ